MSEIAIGFIIGVAFTVGCIVLILVAVAVYSEAVLRQDERDEAKRRLIDSPHEPAEQGES